MKTVVYIIFLLLVGIAGYVGAKGLIADDISREEKWAEYDRRNKTRL